MAKREYSGLFLLAASVLLAFGLLAQLGLTREVSANALGVVLGQVNLILGLLFLGMSGILFVVRNGFSSLRNSRFRRNAIYGLSVFFYCLIFCLFLVLINYSARRSEWFRFDSTEQQVFTFAPQTKILLDSIKDNVEIKAFYVAGDIDEKTRDLLDRASRSNALISWMVVDPEKNTALVDKYGIKKPGSLLLQTINTGSEPSRCVILDEAISEESFANALVKLIRPKVHHLYYLQGNGEGDLGSGDKGGFQKLNLAIEAENMTAKPLVLDEAASIPSDADALLILGPEKQFLPVVLQKVKNYLSEGGRALILVEQKFDTSLPEILAGFGINTGKNMVVDFVSQNSDSKELGIQPVISSYGKHPITKGFTQSLVFSSVCSVQAMEKLSEGTSVTELAFSSSSSWAESNLSLLFSDEPQAQKDDTDLPGPVPIAVAATKKVVSKDPAGEKESRIVAIGDVDFAANIAISDLYNRDFLLNSVNWLVGVEDGVVVRARTMRESRESISNTQFSEMYLITVIAVPEIFLLVGLIFWWWRRSRV